MDWRRGTYICPLYANLRIISAGQDAMYADAVYKMYRLTGDLDCHKSWSQSPIRCMRRPCFRKTRASGTLSFIHGTAAIPGTSRKWRCCFARRMISRAIGNSCARRVRRRHDTSCAHSMGPPEPTSRRITSAISIRYAQAARALRDVETDSFVPAGMVSDPDPANFLPKD